jgi:2-polyprenyl-3-methyl-5-hydroxy-6-metoxy-1,4-benzoquinol methylase
VTTITTAGVRAYFDEEVRKGRRLLPDPTTASGFGTFVKYCRATSLMAQPDVETVLDLGCSVGSIETLFHSQHPARAAVVQIEGIDVSPEAIRKASELDLPNCTFRAYDGTKLPHASESFDLVIAIEVIEHVTDKAQVVREAWRVLRPGGQLFMTTPNPTCWALRAEQFLERAGRWCLRRPAPMKDAFITLSDLSELLVRAGFCPVGPGSQRFWPRLHVSFLGWGILPPLPPRMLALYQRLCVAMLTPWILGRFFPSQLAWSTNALWQKPSDVKAGR